MSGSLSDAPTHFLTRESVSSSGSVDSFRSRSMTTVRMSNKEAVLALGEDLRLLLHGQKNPPLIKDRRYHLKTYPNCFVGHELVTWLVDRKEVETRREAVTAAQRLVDNGVIHHVCDDHAFKDEKLFYRFRKDDGTYAGPMDAPLVAKGQRLYSRLKTGAPGMIADRKYHLHTYKQCFVGKELVDWLLSEGDASNRPEALEFGKKLLAANVIRHVCGEHNFKDEYLFYRFSNDEQTKETLDMKRLLSSSAQFDNQSSPTIKKKNKFIKGDVVYADPIDMGSPRDKGFTAPHGDQEDEYMIMKPADPDDQAYVQMHSAAQEAATIKDRLITGLSKDTTTTFSNTPPVGKKLVTVEDLRRSGDNFVKRYVNVKSDPVGYGFVIRGNSPVYVHSVDPMGPAATVGLMVGEFLYSVNGQAVLDCSHQEVAKIILMGPNSTELVTLCPKHLCS